MKKEMPDLSKTEWVVMKICWKTGQATARQIYEEALKEKKWEYRTVKTMLDRLAQKGYLKINKLGPLCLFEPIASKPKTLSRAISSFIENVLDKSVVPLFAQLVKEKNLSKDEIESLKKIIDESSEEEK